MGSQRPLWTSIEGATVVDLAQPLEATMPTSPSHPGFRLALIRRHGDLVREDGTSSASEILVLGGHSGTHVDALAHISYRGRLYGGGDAESAQRGGRFSTHGVDTIPVILCRGVMLDIARLHDIDSLAAAAPVTARDLQEATTAQGVEIREGDAVLIRTGWSRHWSDPATYVGADGGAPGVTEEGAGWLVDRRCRIAGSDTLAFEHIPAGRGHARMPAHRLLLVEAGVNIVEMLDLERLAKLAPREFLFVLTPLNVVGATGVPVRPVAIVEECQRQP